MSPAIVVADIRSALDAIEFHAFGASEDETMERDGHLFRLLADVRNIRRMLNDIEVLPTVVRTTPDDDEPSIADLAAALATKARPQ